MRCKNNISHNPLEKYYLMLAFHYFPSSRVYPSRLIYCISKFVSAGEKAIFFRCYNGVTTLNM